MTLSRGRLIEKGIYYVDGLCAIQILLGRDSDPLLGGGLYASKYGRGQVALASTQQEPSAFELPSSSAPPALALQERLYIVN